MPIIANAGNQTKWPGVVSRDVISHVGGLKGDVFQFSGQVKGKTLLPLPPQADSMALAIEYQERYDNLTDRLVVDNFHYTLCMYMYMCMYSYMYTYACIHVRWIPETVIDSDDSRVLARNSQVFFDVS